MGGRGLRPPNEFKAMRKSEDVPAFCTVAFISGDYQPHKAY